MSDENPQLSKINDEFLINLFTKTGVDIIEEFSKLLARKKELEAELADVMLELDADDLSLRALRYVDDIHNNMALTVRPLVVDLVQFLNDPDGAFSIFCVPDRYEEEKKPESFAVSVMRSIEPADKPDVRPLKKSAAIGVFASTMAMTVWVGKQFSSPIDGQPRADIDCSSLRKIIVLGFKSGWYICPLAETGQTIIGGSRALQKMFRYYKVRENAIKAAYNYVTDGKLSKKSVIPPELEDAYKQKLLNDEEWAEWRESQEPTGNLGMLGQKEEGEPEILHIWHN